MYHRYDTCYLNTIITVDPHIRAVWISWCTGTQCWRYDEGSLYCRCTYVISILTTDMFCYVLLKVVVMVQIVFTTWLVCATLPCYWEHSHDNCLIELFFLYPRAYLIPPYGSFLPETYSFMHLILFLFGALSIAKPSSSDMVLMVSISCYPRVPCYNSQPHIYVLHLAPFISGWQ